MALQFSLSQQVARLFEMRLDLQHEVVVQEPGTDGPVPGLDVRVLLRIRLDPVEQLPRDVEVRLHDPAAALYGGPDGLDVVRALSRRARALLRPGGALVIEHGELQGAAMRDLLTSDGWRAAATHRDLLGRDRVTTAVR